MLAYFVPLVKRERVRLGLSDEVGVGPALGALVSWWFNRFYHQVTKTPRKLWAAGSRERSAVLPFIYASESEGSSLFLRLVAHQSWVYTVGVQDAEMEILINSDQ